MNKWSLVFQLSFNTGHNNLHTIIFSERINKNENFYRNIRRLNNFVIKLIFIEFYRIISILLFAGDGERTSWKMIMSEFQMQLVSSGCRGFV